MANRRRTRMAASRDPSRRLDGQPVAGATVALFRKNEDTGRLFPVSDGLTDDRGEFKLSTYGRFDGTPAGEYAVTVVKTGRGYADEDGPAPKSLLPEKYARPDTTPLRVIVKDGANEFGLELTGKE